MSPPARGQSARRDHAPHFRPTVPAPPVWRLARRLWKRARR
ncbi:hypothetical protein SFOMI_4422 [Sphingobium fuliginis]|uniref:Uncharacterized protein n=1 Tax=Sphingobium fuliginis (strain ATCC 27551) TaxID=336203 RepID=A0A292ZLK6_SPHSA|nr:hypothetical protein SFOMI_4422 [Sphingobium fuliginis]